jgi:hypothetical protein
MITARSFKKTASLAFTFVYLHVNVAWAGTPSLNPFTIFNLGFSSPARKGVVVFHRFDDDFIRRQNNRRESQTTPDKIKGAETEKAADSIKKGRYENNAQDKKPTKAVDVKPNIAVINKSDVAQEIDDLITPINQTGQVKTQLVDVLKSAQANNGTLTVADQGTLTQINKQLETKGLKVEVVNVNGEFKLQVHQVVPTIRLPETKPGQIPSTILANVMPQQPANETLVRAGAGNSNFGVSIREAGYNGNIGDINRGTIQIDNGTKIVRGAEGTRFVGKVSFTTQNGIKVTIEGNAAGRVTIVKQATRDAEFVEVARANAPVARTLFKAGDSETHVNGTLTHFEAKSGAITREVLATPGRGAGNGNDVKPIELKGSVGQYVIREGRTDSTFEMVNNKVTLVSLNNNVTGASLAKLGNDGLMHATAAGVKIGLEPTFKVLDNPRFDAQTGQAQVNIVFNGTGQTRELVVPKNGRAGEGGTTNADHIYKNVDVKHMGEGRDGTRFQIVGRQDAQMAGTLSLSGESRLSQKVVGENIVYRDQAGAEVGRTLDGVKVTVVALDGSESVSPTPLVALSTNKYDANSSVMKAFASIGVVNTSFVPSLKGGTIQDGEVKLKVTEQNGQQGTEIVSMNINYGMTTGAKVNGSYGNSDMVYRVDTMNATMPTSLRISEREIVVPTNTSNVAISLRNGFLPQSDGSFGNLNGVQVKDGLGAFTLKYNSSSGNVDVHVDSLNNGGKTTFGGETNISGQFIPHEVGLRNQAVFEGGRIFVKTDGPQEFRHQNISVEGAQSSLQDVNFIAHYITVDATGVKTVSAEVEMGFSDTKISVTQPKTGDAGTGAPISTPGAASRNLLVETSKTDTDTTVTIQKESVFGRVAALVTETKKVDDAGKVTTGMSAKLNIFSAGAENLVASGQGFEHRGFQFEEGLRLSINKDGGDMRVSGRREFDDQSRTLTTPDGHMFEFGDLNSATFNSRGELKSIDSSFSLTERSANNATLARSIDNYKDQGQLKTIQGITANIESQTVVEHRQGLNGIESTTKAIGRTIWNVAGNGANIEMKNGITFKADGGMRIVTHEGSIETLFHPSTFDADAFKSGRIHIEGATVADASSISPHVEAKVEKRMIVDVTVANGNVTRDISDAQIRFENKGEEISPSNTVGDGSGWKISAHAVWRIGSCWNWSRCWLRSI